jgi:hypothetical protein
VDCQFFEAANFLEISITDGSCGAAGTTGAELGVVAGAEVGTESPSEGADVAGVVGSSVAGASPPLEGREDFSPELGVAV